MFRQVVGNGEEGIPASLPQPLPGTASWLAYLCQPAVLHQL